MIVYIYNFKASLHLKSNHQSNVFNKNWSDVKHFLQIQYKSVSLIR